MKKFIMVFNEKDKEKLIKQNFNYVGKHGNSYIFKNNINIKLDGDTLIVPTDKVYF